MFRSFVDSRDYVGPTNQASQLGPGPLMFSYICVLPSFRVFMLFRYRSSFTINYRALFPDEARTLNPKP